MSHRESSRYRPEVDGLRALAVVPVLLFHAGIAGFEGGFVGVDVFLVISGYLITRIILGDLEGRKFSFRRFYERRARRILPALFTVLICTVPAAWVCLGPADFNLYARGLLSVLAFGSNVDLWQRSGYFEPDTESNPLLHMWSLSLEEQFYFAFPAVLGLIWWRRRPWLMPIIVIASVLSLGLAQFGSTSFPGANFFLLPSRGWELLAGAAIATIELRKRDAPVGGPFAAQWNLLGVLLIAAAVLFFDGTTPHPSLITMVPVLGTMLVLWFGRSKGLARSILAATPVVAVGLISYSLYLWHQPLLAFARFWLASEPTVIVKGGLLTVSLLLAVLTYRFIETPFRNPQSTSFATVSRALVFSTALLVVVGIGSRWSGGLPQRFGSDVLAAYEADGRDAARLFMQDGKKCHDRDPSEACRLGDAEGAVTWALLGDSHASALAAALDLELSRRLESGLHFGQSGCPFVLNMRVVAASGRERCLEITSQIASLLADTSITTVLVTGRLAAYFHGGGADNGQGGVDDEPIRLESPDGFATDDERRRAVLDGYARSVDFLLRLGKTVILVYPVPEPGWYVPVHVAQRRVIGRTDMLSIPRARVEQRLAAVDSTLDAIKDHPRLVRVRVLPIFCDDAPSGRCYAEQSGRILYSDKDHLSLDGARMVIAEVADAIDRISRRRGAGMLSAEK